MLLIIIIIIIELSLFCGCEGADAPPTTASQRVLLECRPLRRPLSLIVMYIYCPQAPDGERERSMIYRISGTSGL